MTHYAIIWYTVSKIGVIVMAVDKAARNRQNAPARARYEAKAYRKYTIRVRTDGTDGATPDQIEATAAQAGQSVNAWIIGAIAARPRSGSAAGWSAAAIPDDLMLQVQQAAEMMGISVNDWVLQAIKRSL